MGIDCLDAPGDTLSVEKIFIYLLNSQNVVRNSTILDITKPPALSKDYAFGFGRICNLFRPVIVKTLYTFCNNTSQKNMHYHIQTNVINYYRHY